MATRHACPMALPTLACLCFKAFLLVLPMTAMMTVPMAMVTKLRTGTTIPSAHLSRILLTASPLPQPRSLPHRVKPHPSYWIHSDPHPNSPSTAKTGMVLRFTTIIATRACLFPQKCPSHLAMHPYSYHLPSQQTSHHPFAIL